MGIRGHIQTTQPEYEGSCISSWVCDKYHSFMSEHDIEMYEPDGGDTWEIAIDDKLRNLTKELLAGKYEDEIRPLFDGEGVARESFAKELGAFLDDGISVGDKKGYAYIIVDFF